VSRQTCAYVDYNVPFVPLGATRCGFGTPHRAAHCRQPAAIRRQAATVLPKLGDEQRACTASVRGRPALVRRCLCESAMCLVSATWAANRPPPTGAPQPSYQPQRPRRERFAQCPTLVDLNAYYSNPDRGAKPRTGGSRGSSPWVDIAAGGEAGHRTASMPSQLVGQAAHKLNPALRRHLRAWRLRDRGVPPGEGSVL
jgi:hypothetical protein